MKVPRFKHNSPVTEAYRLLRTNLEFLIKKENIRSILVSSAGSGSEGKSTISVNLALSMAEIGKKVILVDADFRKPRLHKLLNIDVSPGFKTVISEGIPLEKAIQSVEDENSFDVVASGIIKDDNTFLLNRFHFTKLIDELYRRYDVVIVDSAPLIISDSLNMAASVDGVVLVVSIGDSNKRAFKEGMKLLNNVDAKVLGIIANKVPDTKDGYYYSYY